MDAEFSINDVIHDTVSECRYEGFIVTEGDRFLGCEGREGGLEAWLVAERGWEGTSVIAHYEQCGRIKWRGG